MINTLAVGGVILLLATLLVFIYTGTTKKPGNLSTFAWVSSLIMLAVVFVAFMLLVMWLFSLGLLQLGWL